MSFLKSKFNGWLADGTRTPYMGGGGGGGQQAPTQTTAYNTNVPEYARPYVETMLGATQQQLFDMDDTGITGFKPYTPYSSDVNNYFAGFSPLQQQAQQSAYNLQTPGQFGLGSGLAGTAGMRALGAGDQASALGSEALGYGATGQMYGDVGQIYGAQGAQQAQLAAQNAQLQAQRFGQGAVRTGQQALGYGAQGAGYGAGATNLGLSATELARQQGLGYGAQGAQFGEAATGVGRSAAELAAQQGLGYGAAGAGYGGAAAALAPVAQTYGQEAADIGMGGLGYGILGAGYGGRGAMAAEQGFGAGEQFARQATDPRATQAYMSPYMQNVVDYQKSQALRDFNIGQGMRKAQAVGQGAFGGSRQAIVESEAERALGSQLQGIAATGSQKAFEDAQRQQQFGANLNLQGLQAGYGGLGLGMQGAGVGLSGLGTALQGQQGRMQGLGQAGQFLGQGMQGAQTGLQGLQGALAGSSQALQGYQTGMQGAQTGLQGLQGALAGSAQGLQGFQTGLQGSQAGMQGVQGALAGYNTGLSGIGQQLGAGQLGLQGTAQGIQGAQAGMQGAGYGLQGVQGAIGAGQYGLAGLGVANQSAGALGQLGTQQLGAETSIIGTQAQQGAQQQALEQSKINQAIQDYAIQQQYPLMQLGFMSNMLRGLPMQSQTTQLYQAQPSALQQGIGLTGAASTLFGGKAEGGVIKMAEGGIAGYKYGGIAEPKLAGMADNLSIPQLVERLKDPALTKGERDVFQEALAAKQNTAARSSGIAAAGGGLFNTMGYAGGGILAFADEGLVEDPQFGGSSTPMVENPRMSVDELFRLYPGLEGKVGLSQIQDYTSGRSVPPESAKAPAPASTIAAAPKPAPAPAPAPRTPGTAPTGPSAGPATAKGLEEQMREQERLMGPNTVGQELEAKIAERLAGMDKRASQDDRAAMRKAFVEFGTKASPGGFLQGATSAIGTYGDASDAAKKVREGMDLELTKMQADIKKGQRAEKRGNLDAASKSYENAENRQLKIAEMQNQIKVAGIQASRASDFERQYAQYAEDEKAAGRKPTFEGFKRTTTVQDETARLNAMSKAEAALGSNLAYMRLMASSKPEDKQKAEQMLKDKIAQYMNVLGPSATSATPAAPAVPQPGPDGTINIPGKGTFKQLPNGNFVKV